MLFFAAVSKNEPPENKQKSDNTETDQQNGNVLFIHIIFSDSKEFLYS